MFGKLGEIAHSFFGEKRQSVLGVDVGSSSVKIVQLRKEGGRAVLETYGEIALGPYGGVEVGRAVKLGPDKMADAVHDVMREANVSTTAAAMTVPMRSSMTTVIDLPDLPDDQLATMVPIEARKYIPVPMSQVTLDWFRIPKPELPEGEEDATPAAAKKAEVMLVAIHNEALDSLSQVVATAKLDVSFFEIEMFSAIRSAVDPGERTATMVIDVGAGATKVYIVERGIIRDSHTVPRGSQEVTLSLAKGEGFTVDYAEKVKRNAGKNPDALEAKLRAVSDLVFQPIWSEAATFILGYQKRSRSVVAKAVLLGGGGMFPGLAEQASAKLGIEVQRADPFAKVVAPAFLQGVLRENGMAFAGAIGIALRELAAA